MSSPPPGTIAAALVGTKPRESRDHIVTVRVIYARPENEEHELHLAVDMDTLTINAHGEAVAFIMLETYRPPKEPT
jgi:hypothetical protein